MASLELPKPAPIVDQPDVGPRRARWILGGLGGVVLTLAVLYQALDVETYWVPSEAMTPTISSDDRIVTWDLGSVERGDIVVFTKPEGTAGPTSLLINRVIGLGGETISFRDGQVLIDGVLLAEPYLEADVQTGARRDEPTEIAIPQGQVFVMGDARSQSSDSRFFGPIDVSSISSNNAWVWKHGD